MTLKHKLYDIVFEADTRVGKYFDIFLIVIILLSITIVMLESVPYYNKSYGTVFKTIEWIITGLFTIEYILRLSIVNHPFKYAFSFFGIIDFLSVIPTFLAVFISGAQGLLVIRALRLLRVFRILKLTRQVNESQFIYKALMASRHKIFVFLYSILMLVIIFGTIMYLVESPESGFTSIPRSIYWAIVTLTTVGFGDITPDTNLGQFIAGVIMIFGYAIIAVPTGIVTAEISAGYRKNVSTQVCPECLWEGHDSDAEYCKKCGALLNPPDDDFY